MIQCIMERIGDSHLGHLHRCKVCGRDYPSREGNPEAIRRPCPAVPVDDAKPYELPRLPMPHVRLKNFTLAAISHAFAGAPTCTQEQVDERYAICRACPLYLPSADNPDVGHCTHAKCGCEVTRAEKFASKLAWQDQDCPLGNWPKITATGDGS